MFQNFGVHFTKSIRRRLIVKSSKTSIKHQMRLTNIYHNAKKPTRFTYRIEYLENGSFTRYLISQD
jgi:hypothetical protein